MESVKKLTDPNIAKERPILFSGEMVSAILQGCKTQTRRVIKPQPEGDLSWVREWGHTFFTPDGHISGRGRHPATGYGEIFLRCPYQIGGRLWVRETFAYIWPDVDPVPLRECTIEYRADSGSAYPAGWPEEEAKGNDDAPKWRPSIFMPRWASRISLEVVCVCVERVQTITDDDAIEEGVDRTNTSIPTYARQRFHKLWDSINAKRGYSWDSNPWIWAITFRELERP